MLAYRLNKDAKCIAYVSLGKCYFTEFRPVSNCKLPCQKKRDNTTFTSCIKPVEVSSDLLMLNFKTPSIFSLIALSGSAAARRCKVVMLKQAYFVFHQHRPPHTLLMWLQVILAIRARRYCRNGGKCGKASTRLASKNYTVTLTILA